MGKKKLNVFLGGYINVTNAQNLNCLAIARYLDKSKFNIYTLEVYSGSPHNRGDLESSNIKTFWCFKPFFMSRYLGYLWGIYHCDVAYLPKREIVGFNRLILKILGRKSFFTDEGILDEDNLVSAKEALGALKRVLKSYEYTDKLFAITKFVKDYNFEKWAINSEEEILYLGSDATFFKCPKKTVASLATVMYIGRLKRRKGLYDMVELAKLFSHVKFVIIGNGEERQALEDLIVKEDLRNIDLKGTLSHKDLKRELALADLHVLPSRSEGFPKVILETAAAGVPSIVYADYGAEEWIETGKNGWVVNELADIVELIEELKRDPKKILEVSASAVELAEHFDWTNRIKQWEEVILSLENG